MICELCDKHRKSANRRSHSNIKTKRVQGANIQSVNALIGKAVRRVAACTNCIKSGYIQKAYRTPQRAAQ